MNTNEIVENKDIIEEALEESTELVPDCGSSVALCAVGGVLVVGVCVGAALIIKKIVKKRKANKEEESVSTCVIVEDDASDETVDDIAEE